MQITLYQATIPSYLQIVASVIGLVDKAEAHCGSKNIPPGELIQAKLADDMLPFTFQITSVCHHSIGAIEGLRKGVFSPSRSMAEDFPGLRSKLTNTLAALQMLTEDEVNAFVGNPMRFEYGDYQVDYMAEEFLLSFSQPNFYFHAATAYDILRWQGVPLGKRDFIGKVRSL